MEKPFATKRKESHQKLRGGYYTPRSISDFLAKWAIRSKDDTVLEPSCGDGAMLESAVKALRGLGATEIPSRVCGIEVDVNEAAKGRERLASLGICSGDSIQNGDFFQYCLSYLYENQRFDAIIGNPPFIRYQNFLEEHRVPAFELMRRAGMRPTRLTNAWVPFIVAAAFLLSKQGRLAMVVPAELLQVNYASELRLFLSDYFQRISLITFRQLVFEGIQQEVVLLLAEKKDKMSEGIATFELDDDENLETLFESEAFSKREIKPLNHSRDKWTQYFLCADEIGLLRELTQNEKLTVLGDFMDVDVGIVTGQNSFFVVNKDEICKTNLRRYAKKIVSRSGHLRGVLFNREHWEQVDGENLATNLLDLPRMDFDSLPADVKSYVARGEQARIHEGYKCRIRSPWYSIPSPWIPDAFLLRQIHLYPKLIVNNAGATCTDTIHRVKLTNGRSIEELAATFLNSLTFAFSEVLGRSYGGGVLELEPREAESLPIPTGPSSTLDIEEIHKLLLQNRLDDVLDMTDVILLRDHLGLTKKQTKALRSIWAKLRNRRVNRKRKERTLPLYNRKRSKK